MIEENKIYTGDCLEKMEKINSSSIDLIYLDPPFFTQEIQISKNRKTGEEYKFNDKWKNMTEYLEYMKIRLRECQRILSTTGSIFLHCDNKASHYLKVLMDEIFGYDNFQSEIIWYYKRWSNAKKGLLNNHQKILFYSKTTDFKFNTLYNEYAQSTNIDQILQKRERDATGKSTYKLAKDGKEVLNKPKKGVPMNDVWEIPFLNPTAKERVGYPTQKPINLLERIIKLVTDEGDIVLDPFVGSGTSIVAAKLLKRKYIGIDKSEKAIKLAKERLINPIKTISNVAQGNIDIDMSEMELKIIESMGAMPVRRNMGIDGMFKEYYQNKPVFIKIQRETESLKEAKEKLLKAKRGLDSKLLILVQIREEKQLKMDLNNNIEKEVIEDGRTLIKIKSLNYQLSNYNLK